MSLLEQLKALLVPESARARERDLEERLERFRRSVRALEGKYTSKQQLQTLSKKWGKLYRTLKKSRYSRRHPLYPAIQEFLRSYEQLDKRVSSFNALWFEQEKRACRALLSDIDGKSLDEQQRTAVVCDADRTLVVAGAGSGKTLTIAAKVKYLCQRKNVSPEDILLLAFTRKAAEEMTGRIRDGLGLRVRATTFHKLGLDLLTRNTGKRPEVVDQLNEFVEDYLERTVLRRPAQLRDLIRYFAYYLRIPADLEQYESLGAAYEAERDADFETLRGKVQRERFLAEQEQNRKSVRRTLKNERVKSLEEVQIANFLFLNGVEYEYERLYPYQSEDPARKAYRPDFFLPEYDLYLEHFGINRKGRVPLLSRVEEQKYLEDMEWKRDFHRRNGTVLLETYSWYASEGRLLEELERTLKEAGVRFREPDFGEIYRAVCGTASQKYLSEFRKLCCTFLLLFKSGGHRPEELPTLGSAHSDGQNAFHRNRTALFLRILAPMLEDYEAMLREQGAVDFPDMINRAAELVEEGCPVHPWKWVIVDEYQDISKARYRLVKAILERTGAKLLCVGDDWQSIYRFAGSDIALFTHFESFFGPSEILALEHTYRNAQQLIDEAGAFVKRNPEQLHKHLRSEQSLEYPIVVLFYEENPSAKLKLAVDKCIQERGADSTILLLGRTGYDLEPVRSSGLFRVRASGELTYVDSPSTPISFLTVHRSKGLEADNVILLNLQNDTLGFPNKISDDPLLKLVLTQAEPFPFAEERRLLYVALTRTRNRVYLLVEQNSPSVFLEEFHPSESVYIQRPRGEGLHVPCPRCKKGRLTLRRNDRSKRLFVGCSNYPRCDFTLNDPSVLSRPRHCPECGGLLVHRKSEWGSFYGCSNYPTCSFTERDSRQARKRTQ